MRTPAVKPGENHLSQIGSLRKVNYQESGEKKLEREKRGITKSTTPGVLRKGEGMTEEEYSQQS